jgi:trimeric autotransporter adhesin
MFGTASNTYTMAGITSGASRTAQGAPTHLVTSNTGGDLAAHTFAELGLATTGDVAGLQTQINRLGRRDRELTEGIAAVSALAQPIHLPGQHFAVRAGWGGYDDANAVGFSAAGVVASNLLSQGRGTLTLDGGLGFGTDEGEVAGRAGATIGW